MNTIVNFSKVEIIENIKDSKSDIPKRNKLEFKNCGLVITGNNLIVIISEASDHEYTNISTSLIFNLENIYSYRTYQKY